MLSIEDAKRIMAAGLGRAELEFVDVRHGSALLGHPGR